MAGALGARAESLSPDPTGHAATLTIDLAALAANWRLLRDAAAPAECAAAVKADAYGIGLDQAGPALWGAGCRTFFVAHLSEGEQLRRVLATATVYVLNGLVPGIEPRLAAAGLRPTLGSRDEVAAWAAFCRSAGRRLPAALHVDTGLNRLGLPTGEIGEVAASPDLADFEPALLMSHFAASEAPADPMNGAQIEAFEKARAALPALPASLANSSGIFLPARPHLAMVRPGYALYGGNPTPGRANPMQPVVHLEAPIIQTRAVEAGARVGYNGRWTAPGPRRLATLSAGYADGIFRTASGWDGAEGLGGAALVGGTLCPFVGTISMDLIVLDATDAPSGSAERGAPATLIGGALDIDEVARRAGTIGYEILTRLGARYTRRYLGG